RPETAGDRLTGETAAARALTLGFPSVAASLYEALLAAEPESAAHDDWVLALTSARLEAGQLEQARQALGRLRGAPGSAARLRAGLIAAQRGQVVARRGEIATAQAEASAGRWRSGLGAGRRGRVVARRGEIATAQAEASAVRAAELSEGDLPWFYFLQGLLAEAAKDAEGAGRAYEQAEEAAVNEWQR